MSSLPSLRSRIDSAFNDSELRDLCFEHFPAVSNAFTSGMTKGQMIQLLLDHCMRRQLGSMLLDALEQERPRLVGAEREILLAQLDAARFNPALLDAPPVLALPLDHIPDAAPLPAGSRMPLARNPLFVGREADLKQLAATLKGGGTAAIGQIVAATGHAEGLLVYEIVLDGERLWFTSDLLEAMHMHELGEAALDRRGGFRPGQVHPITGAAAQAATMRPFAAGAWAGGDWGGRRLLEMAYTEALLKWR